MKVVVAGLVRLLAGEDVGGFIGVIGRWPGLQSAEGAVRDVGLGGGTTAVTTVAGGGEISVTTAHTTATSSLATAVSNLGGWLGVDIFLPWWRW